MNENRQIFVNTYLTNGYNATQAYKTAYPNCKGGWNRCGHKLLTFNDVKQAINKAKKDIESWLEDGRKLCDKLFMERYIDCVAKNENANAIRCIENKAKGEGYYEKDNAQKAEANKLSEDMALEAKEIAKWRLLKGAG